MIVRDEARHLAACLESARPWVQELIVVDTGSTDGTPDLARRLGARVEAMTWPNDFSAARNVALAQAKGEWVLSLDADERLVAETGPNLSGLLAAGDAFNATKNAMRAFALALYSKHDPGAAQPPPDFSVRLFPNHPRIRWRRPIHEQPAWVGGTEGRLEIGRTADVVIEHLGYIGEERQRKQTTTRNLALLDAAIAADAQDPASFFFRGEERYIAADYRGAIEDFAQAIALCEGRQAPPELARAHVLEADARLRLGDLRGAARSAEVGARRYDDPLAWRMLGQVQETLGSPQEAQSAYAAAIAAGERAAPRLGAVAPAYRAATLAPALAAWGKLSLAEGNVAEALRLFSRTHEQDASNVDGLRGLAQCALVLGNPADAAQFVEEARRLTPDDSVIHLLDARVRASELGAGEEMGLRHLAARHPEDVWVRIQLADMQAARGEWETAVELLGAGLEDPPTTAELYQRLGAALTELKRYDDASAAYGIALALRPDDQSVRLRLATVEALGAGSNDPRTW